MEHNRSLVNFKHLECVLISLSIVALLPETLPFIHMKQNGENSLYISKASLGSPPSNCLMSKVLVVESKFSVFHIPPMLAFMSQAVLYHQAFVPLYSVCLRSPCPGLCVRLPKSSFETGSGEIFLVSLAPSLIWSVVSTGPFPCLHVFS